MPPEKKFKIEKPYYPIVYVRGYAMRSSEREETFNDTYYGFSATSVEKRQAPPPRYFEADVFEGQLIRFMKMKDYGYADAVNRGLEIFPSNPSRSIWICRFYDQDYITEKLRSIEEHAEDLYDLVCTKIPQKLKETGVDLGNNDQDYKVILIAHSMGGLVCRTLIQNLLPYKYNQDPKRWIHRLVTMGTPHKGIELGRIPDFLEDLITNTLNPFDANIFKEDRMRSYLKLQEKNGSNYKYDINSLGPQDTNFYFPVKRCLCLIGSDFKSYNLVKEVTGNFSDGLVKQDRAYIVAGQTPADGRYKEEMKPFWANVHRAHSGFKGIVNSYESYENIQRFLFGNIKTEISLRNIQLSIDKEPDTKYFYDFEFMFSIRKTNVYLHRREQEPCENAMRLEYDKIPNELFLHTFFMNSGLKDPGSNFSHFMIKLRIVEHRVKEGFLWDHEYPERQIYNETAEVRIGDSDPSNPGEEIEFRWLSDGDKWNRIKPDNGDYHFHFRKANAITAEIVIKAGAWPDYNLTRDE
ncbi:MAG: lipase family alpha/beta hydrolase [Ignavibacteria bacterium]